MNSAQPSGLSKQKICRTIFLKASLKLTRDKRRLPSPVSGDDALLAGLLSQVEQVSVKVSESVRPLGVHRTL